jgi:hypothetical protein
MNRFILGTLTPNLVSIKSSYILLADQTLSLCEDNFQVVSMPLLQVFGSKIV